MRKLSVEERAVVETYGHLFNNTGGNNLIELMERVGVTYFNNPLVAELQGSCYSQTLLLLKLQNDGMLVPPGGGPATSRLLAALDGMDLGCTVPGFRDHENGYGDSGAGNELQDARESIAKILGHVVASTESSAP